MICFCFYPVENCSISVSGNGSGYLVSALNPLSSSTELDISGPNGIAKVVGRKSELFDNPIYDQPKLLASMDSVRSPASGEKEEEYSKLACSLYSITSRQSSADMLTQSQTSSYFGRSCESFSALQGQLRGKPAYHKYEEIELRRHSHSRGGGTKGDTDRCNQVDRETSSLTTEGEGMVTVVNASYEALPCHNEKLTGGKSIQHSVLHATGQISDHRLPAEHVVVSCEVANKKRPGYRPSFSAVEERCEENQAKPSCLKKKTSNTSP